MKHHGIGAVHFEASTGVEIEFWTVKNIYRSEYPDVGRASNRWPEDLGGGTLWNYDQHQQVADDAVALEAIRWEEHPDPYFEAPVYNLEVEDFHTYYVREDGIWVRGHKRNSH